MLVLTVQSSRKGLASRGMSGLPSVGGPSTRRVSACVGWTWYSVSFHHFEFVAQVDEVEARASRRRRGGMLEAMASSSLICLAIVLRN